MPGSEQVFLATGTLERNHDSTCIAFADTFSADVFALGEGNVNDAALMRRHGLERDGTTAEVRG